MSVLIGKDGQVSADSGAVAAVQSWALSESEEEVEISGIGEDWTDVDGGQKSWGVELSAHLNYSDAGQSDFVVGDVVALELQPSVGTGLPEYTGNARVTSVNESGAKSGPVSISMSCKGKGALSRGTQA
jgi:hypothetical protein